MRVTYERTGPFFEADPNKVVDRMMDDLLEDIAQEGVNEVHARLGQVLKHPTGYYSSRVVTNLASPKNPYVWDSNVVYGPWLEGVSGRNSRSRFKGYHTFQKVAQELDTKALQIAQPTVDRAMRELNG